jgi:hypothetical protein
MEISSKCKQIQLFKTKQALKEKGDVITQLVAFARLYRNRCFYGGDD